MSAEPKSELLFYQAPDGRTRLEVRMEGETAWLMQAQMAELFQTTQQNVSLHIRNIYEEGELTPEATHKESLSVQPKGQLQPSATVKEFLIVRQEGSRQVSRSVEHYNLDVIISVGSQSGDSPSPILRQLVAEFSRVSILSQAVRECGRSLWPKWARAMTTKLQQAVEEMRPVP